MVQHIALRLIISNTIRTEEAEGRLQTLTSNSFHKGPAIMTFFCKEGKFLRTNIKWITTKELTEQSKHEKENTNRRLTKRLTNAGNRVQGTNRT